MRIACGLEDDDDEAVMATKLDAKVAAALRRFMADVERHDEDAQTVGSAPPPPPVGWRAAAPGPRRGFPVCFPSARIATVLLRLLPGRGGRWVGAAGPWALMPACPPA